MHSQHSQDSPPAKQAREKTLPGQELCPATRSPLLLALVVIGLGVMFAAEAVLAAEPGNGTNEAAVMTLASLGRIASGSPLARVISVETACPSDQCRPLNQEPPGARVPTASTPIDEWTRNGSPVSHPREYLTRPNKTEDSHLGLRILRPVYAILAMPHQPAWSPAAERPAVERILVGFRFVVPF